MLDDASEADVSEQGPACTGEAGKLEACSNFDAFAGVTLVSSEYEVTSEGSLLSAD